MRIVLGSFQEHEKKLNTLEQFITCTKWRVPVNNNNKILLEKQRTQITLSVKHICMSVFNTE